MIVLDTNVVSELLRLEPHPGLERWLSGYHPDDLDISAITVAELLAGVMEMSAGRKRATTEERVRRIIAHFGPTYPSFGAEAAEIYAALVAKNPEMDTFDGQIAAIARAHGATVATRNVKHFRALGVDLIDPWDA